MIHGGGLLNGAGDQHDGSLIVKTDHIIVVSINYRLGVFGFLDVPGLGTSARTANGNYGLLDQEAALRLGAPQHRPRSAATRARSRSPASRRAAGPSAR